MILSLGVMASETDNFSLPTEPAFADLGSYFELVHTRAIEESVQRVNTKIEKALKEKDPAVRARRLSACQQPEFLAAEVVRRFGDPLTEVHRIERPLRGTWGRRTFPGQIRVYPGKSLSMHAHFPLDPRLLGALDAAGTVRAYGVHFGTDKLLHFHQLGYQYYQRYRSQMREGMNPEAAGGEVIRHFANGAFFAESRFFGSLITGVYSNADMAANYAGLKFFLNLTEPTLLLGSNQPPLVVRCGVFWRVADHVRPDSGWFRVFVTDHWNEALNPNLYDWTMRPRVERFLRDRASHIRAFYTQKEGRPDDPGYFAELARALATYGGEEYGHSGQFDRMLHIGNTCYPEPAGS